MTDMILNRIRRQTKTIGNATPVNTSQQHRPDTQLALSQRRSTARQTNHILMTAAPTQRTLHKLKMPVITAVHILHIVTPPEIAPHKTVHNSPAEITHITPAARKLIHQRTISTRKLLRNPLIKIIHQINVALSQLLDTTVPGRIKNTRISLKKFNPSHFAPINIY